VKGTGAERGGVSRDVDPNRPPFPAVALTGPVGTWFRDSNLTQYGGHAHIDMKGVTGSECTGQAAGAAGLLMSYAKQLVQRDLLTRPLTANEVKQILTLTADDDLPGAAADRNPTSPFTWALEFGIGIEPTSFRQFAIGSGPSRIGFDATTTPPRRPGALLANLSLADVMNAFPAGTDFSAPPSGVVVQGQANVPSNQFAFTVRLRVFDHDDPTNFGEDREV